MAIYSHSKLSTFEQCKLKYKLRYIDKIKPPVEKSIEAHLGICVHGALEWLYYQVKEKKIPELDELIEKYVSLWQKDYKDNFLIVKSNMKPEDYFNRGISFLINYYLKHKPFEEGTLELEKKVWVNLHPSSAHKIIGYIDRLAFNKEKGEYEIHDYKTANSLPKREDFEKDRQLALYSIAIKQLYGEDKPVVLIWHYLSHNVQIISRRTNEQLDNLKKSTLELIKEIENTKEFPPTKSILCDWCEYKEICPAWGNSLTEDLTKSQSKLSNF